MNDMKFTTAGDYMADMKEYDPQSMIDSSAAENERLGRKTVERIHKPTGGETWQTKATAKGAVPKYYSPTELLSMRVDKLEEMVKNLNERLSNISAEMLQPIDNDEIYERPTESKM